MRSPRHCRHVLAALMMTMPLFSVAQSTDVDIVYQSAFTHYKNYQDDQQQSWKDANDAVQGSDAMAGHNMENMKTMSAPASTKKMTPESAPKKGASTSAPMMDHSGMKKQ